MNPRQIMDLKRLRHICELMEGRKDDPHFSVEGSYFMTLLRVIEEQAETIKDLDQKLASVVEYIPHEDLPKAFPWLAEHQKYLEDADSE